MAAVAVIITACSILFSGPIDNHSPALQNGTCREFREVFQPEYTPYGNALDPIIVGKPVTEVTPQQCMTNGQIAISKWQVQYPSFIVNKWRCEVGSDKQDI